MRIVFEVCCVYYFVAADIRLSTRVDYDLSLEMFTSMRAVDPFRTDEVDTYSNILYTMKKQADLSQLAQHFMTVNKDRPEVSLVIGKLLLVNNDISRSR